MILLLDLPQELLDLIATHCSYFELIHLEKTCRQLYHTIHNNAILRQALVDLETYWASPPYGMRNPPKGISSPRPTPYPCYSLYANHAPCYTCLSLQGPQNLSDAPQAEGIMSMLPWDGCSLWHPMQIGALDLDRKCIECTIQTARNRNEAQEWHTDLTGRWRMYCTRCNTYSVTWPDRRYLTRLVRSGVCLRCFDVANPGWRVFRERLSTRLMRIQRYEAWLRHMMELGRHVQRDGQALGFRRDPRKVPPEEDVKEDWVIWRHVFAEKPEVGWAELHAMFKEVIAPMSGYSFWMLHTDGGYRPCKHKAEPPWTDELAAFGEWPRWEWIVEEIKEAQEKGCKCFRCEEPYDRRRLISTWVTV